MTKGLLSCDGRRHGVDPWLASAGLVLFLAAPAQAGADAFQEVSGQVIMEAEHFDNRVPRNGQDWVLNTSISGYTAEGYLESSPNSGTTRNTNYVTSSPEVAYNVQFTSTGTYYIWVRGSGGGGNDDSIHIGLDGAGPASADRLTGLPTAWTWKRDTMDSAPATLAITTPGLHTIHVWMREDGSRIDRILLRKSSSSTAPSGSLPESSRISTGDTTPPSVSLTDPENNSDVGGASVLVGATASDNVGVAGVQFRLDGSNLGAEDTTPPYEIIWDASSTPEGLHVLDAMARDAAGMSVTSTQRSVNVDNTAPVITITSPSDGEVIVAPES